jgi:hypothetical protein
MSDLNFQSLPWQQEVFADKTRFKVIAAGRRCGKSRLQRLPYLLKDSNALLEVLFCMLHPPMVKPDRLFGMC